MADFDSKLPIRSLAVDNTTEIANASGVTINPAKEDGNLATITTNTNNLDVLLSTRASEATLSTISGNIDVALSTRASEATLSSINTNIDVALSTRASEATLASVDTSLNNIETNIDVALSTRASEATLSAINGKLNSLGQKTMANSVPVVIASDQSSVPVTFNNTTVEITDYKKAPAVAAASSDTHTYTPGSTVKLDQIDVSASGQVKVEVKVGLIGSETSRWVGFTSKGNLWVSWKLPNPISVPVTDDVLVIVTNMDNQAMDLYSTIMVH